MSTSLQAQAKEKAPLTQDPMMKNYLIGLDFVKKGDWDGAIDALLQSVYFARNSYAPLSYYWLGVSYEAKHQDLKAIEAAKKYVEQGTGSVANGHLLLAELYIRNDRLDEAEGECTDAISDAGLTPTGARGHFWYGKIFEARKEYAEADDQYMLALGDPPWTYYEAWEAHAEIAMKNKDWSSAYTLFNSMLTSEHKLKGFDIVKCYRNMGVCLVNKGDHQGALLNWHKALDFNQTDADTHLELGIMFDSEIHMQSAIDEYKQYIRFGQDPMKVAKAKERVLMLEQKLNPTEAPYVAKPSPYIRKQYQRSQPPPQQQEQPVQGLPQPKDSGF